VPDLGLHLNHRKHYLQPVDEEQQQYITSTINRFDDDEEVNRIKALRDEDDMMLELIDKMQTDVEVIPTVGQYFTFIYKAKTPRVEYDRFPLVAVTSIYRWGFSGINFHWGASRNYTWPEVQSSLYRVYPMELKTLRAIPYQNFTINN
jgi:hypothetical protein